ncbi:MAG: hypothetical protein EOP07_04670 [Proteobacteria bacterium]|nr:MAG: hypothetical protein EOP07_04670 [Pseudomonadota bacterium]
MISTLNPLTGSAILKFNPRFLADKALRSEPRIESAPLYSDEMSVPTSNRLIRNQALYFSEPEDVRKCLEKLVPDQNFCLILTNKAQ